MSEALLLVAEGYEQIAAGIRKMVAAQKDTPKKEEKPVKKAEKKETPVADTPKEEAATEGENSGQKDGPCIPCGKVQSRKDIGSQEPDRAVRIPEAVRCS